MFGQFSWKEKPDSGLDFPGGDGGPLVVVGKTGSFGCNALKDVIDKRVHDAHGLGGHTGVGVDLFQDLVDVDSIRFLTLAVLLLVSLGNGLGGLSCLLGGFTGYFWWHVVVLMNSEKLIIATNLVSLFIAKLGIHLKIAN